MGLALGWMAIALAGLADAPKAERANGPIHYTVRFVETEGLGWREAAFTRLTPVSRQGAATIWTAPRGVSQQIRQFARTNEEGYVAQKAESQARNGAPLHFAFRKNQQLITQVAWNGDDRPEAGKPETVRTGPMATLTGRQLDQGVLVQLVLEDTEVRAVHRIKLPGAEAHACKATPAAAEVKPQVFIGQGKAAGLTAYAYQIPDPRDAGCCAAACCGTVSKPVPKTAGADADRAGVLPAIPYITLPLPGEITPSGTIREIRIESFETIPIKTIKAKLLSRAGQPIDEQKIKADLKTLMHTKRFSDVHVYYAPLGGTNIVYFKVHEKPTSDHADPAAETCPKAPAGVKLSASIRCAPHESEVIRAHLEKLGEQLRSAGDEWERFWLLDQPEALTPFRKSSKTSETCPKAGASHSVEVPEIDSQEIAGEWLIPKDGILLVSFGPHTVADQDGKAVVRERLAIIEAESIADGAVQRTTGRTPSAVPAPRPTTPALDAPRAMPAPVVPELPTAVPVPPSRSIPQGAHPDGTPAELPPLPADEIGTPHPSPSAEPSPTPQTKKPQPTAAPAADAQAKKTGYHPPPPAPVLPSLFGAMPNIDLQFLLPIKPMSFQLPFNRRLEIEIFGRVVPNPDPVDDHKCDE